MNSSIEGLLAFIGRNIEGHIKSHSESHIEGQIESHIESHIKSHIDSHKEIRMGCRIESMDFPGAPQYQKLTKMYHFDEKRLF